MYMIIVNVYLHDVYMYETDVNLYVDVYTRVVNVSIHDIYVYVMLVNVDTYV